MSLVQYVDTTNATLARITLYMRYAVRSGNLEGFTKSLLRQRLAMRIFI